MDAQYSSSEGVPIKLGIRANLPQFSLLVLVNAFVGAMVGMERSILPLIAENDFGITSHSAVLSFLITFGIVKAFSNLIAGRYSDTIGRKKLLVAGWLVGIPVPFILIWAPTWSWVVAANILLGINQGLCWSTTVIMKIDLAGSKSRGLAMGLNEFAGYIAVAVSAYWSASIAQAYGFRPFPFYIGIRCSVIGFLVSSIFVNETHEHAKHESRTVEHETSAMKMRSFGEIFALVSWRDKNLFSCSQAGLVNNLNDGVVWGLFPLFFATRGFTLNHIGLLAGLYPAVWGVSQLLTGATSDRVGRKWMIVVGMWMQVLGLWLAVFEATVEFEVAAMCLLGVGTAMVYPTLLAAVGDTARPEWRASAVGVYRLWRDIGYAIGAMLCGLIADAFGSQNAIIVVAALTFSSGVIVAARFKDGIRTT
ncbi:MAG: MFS transporter [Ignavibacteria bacterium]|nr:MFS transporter [Ignavibacteria bacterium]